MAYFIMTWDNILHMFLTPWAGAKSDSTWTRFGRRKTWLIIGLPIAIIGFVLIPLASSLTMIIVFIMLTNIGTGIFRAPIRAWMGDFFNPEDRSKAEAPVHLLGGVAVVIVALVGGRLFDTINPAAPFILTAVVIVIATIPILIWVREDKELIPESESSQATVKEEDRPSVLDMLGRMFQPGYRSVLFAFTATFLFHTAHAAYQAGISSFGVFDLGMTAGRISQLIGLSGIVYILLAFPSGLLATRFSPRRIMLIGMLIYALNTFAAGFFVSSEQGILLTLLIGGAAWSFVFVNSLPLVLNSDKGTNFGVFTGLYFLAFQAASVAGPLISGAFVQLAGQQRAMWFVVAICMILALVSLTQVSGQDFEEVEAVLAAD